MKRLIGILTMAAAVNFTLSQPAPAEDGASAKTSGKDRIVREQVASTVKAAGEYVKTEFDNILSDNISALKEHKRKITREFAVGSSPALIINNGFGNIRIIEGGGQTILFRVTITGKGKDSEDAEKYAESVDVKFRQDGGAVSAETVFERINCRNCGRSVDYEVTVPENTKQTLTNKYGDVNINSTAAPLDVKVEFGKFYANELAEANIRMAYGGGTVNKCGRMNLKSSFSKFKLGEIGSLSAEVAYDGYDIEELGEAEIESGFSTMDVKYLKTSFVARKFNYGSLGISRVDDHFSVIIVDAGFSKVKVSPDAGCNFRATLYSRFGSIRTGNVAFYEKTLDKKDAIVGIVGKIKDPSATMYISNEYGGIVLQ